MRQLGSIYEGRAEFRLRITSERLAIVKGKRDKEEKVIPYREAAKQQVKILTVGRGREAVERTLPKGAVYIENDRHEREGKRLLLHPGPCGGLHRGAHGRPGVADHLEALDHQSCARRSRLTARRSSAGPAFKKNLVGDDPEKVANEPRWRAVVDELFEFRALDPWMGSGHSLVETVDFITDR